MKRTTTALVLILALAGCSTGQLTVNVNGRVPFAPTLEFLIGEWTSDGELALIVERDGEDVVVRNPPNDTWRFEITDISTDGTRVMFTQRNFVSDGSDHPFNGIPCECTISTVPDDHDSLNFELTSPQLPEGESEVYTRLR